MNKEEESEKILEKSQAVDPSLGWKAEYKIIINTPFQSVGKYYNMVLKELRDFGFNNLTRVGQSLSASPTSAFYSDVARRRAYAKEQFDKGMGLINNLIKEIMQLIYSLREFDQIINNFKKLEEGKEEERIAAELNLRRTFMDEVDIKKGRGSMNNLATAQGMEFVTLRDAFFAVKGLEDIKDLTINDRVKRILKDRFNEYLNWKKEYKRDIMSRKKIQTEYLRNQVESLKMQLDWVKPFYKVLQQLEIDTGVGKPDLLPGIDTSVITTNIRARSKRGDYATAFADIQFRFKTSPVQVQGEHGQAYHHRFRTEITYTPYVMSNSDYDKLVQVETFEDMEFLEEVAGQSLKAIKDDLEKFLGGGIIEPEKKKEKKKMKTPFDILLYPVKPLLNGVKDGFSQLRNKGKTDYKFRLENELKELNEVIVNQTFDVYENFKDENGFITWSASLA